jgi:hypothetical protein
MNREDIIRMANKAYGIDEEGKPFHPSALLHLEIFAKLVAEHERDRIKQANAPEIERVNAHIKELQGQIETLHAMYELATKQRDYLMEQQNAQVAAMRGEMQ